MELRTGRLIKAIRDAILCVAVIGLLILALFGLVAVISSIDFPIVALVMVIAGFSLLVKVFYDFED